jgi:rubrerythrin
LIERSTTRRHLVRRGVTAGAGVAIASALSPVAARAVLAGADTDLELVEAVIGLEQRAAVAYATIANGGLLDEEVRRAADAFAEQERDHVEALTAAVEDLGGRAPDDPVEVEGLGALASQREALELAIDLEDQLIRAYVDAAGRLASTALRRTAVQILGNEAQHLAVLRQQLGQDPVPDAFEDGESSP